jgi:hypothetical protein
MRTADSTNTSPFLQQGQSSGCSPRSVMARPEDASLADTLNVSLLKTSQNFLGCVAKAHKEWSPLKFTTTVNSSKGLSDQTRNQP